MYISISEIVSRHGMPKGIIHVGAHFMEERKDYMEQGLLETIWVEADPVVYSSIDYVNSMPGGERAFCCAASDEDGIVEFNVADSSQSSSMLEFELHSQHHPWVSMVAKKKVQARRMDSLLLEHGVDMSRYDFINLDIQGAELLALKGFGDLLHGIRYIYSEVNSAHLYKGCALVGEIDEYLAGFGFERVETQWTPHEWGDALYVKK